MRSRNSILSGIFLVGLGVLFLGVTNHWWQLDWRFLIMLWPALLIVGGLRLMLPPTAWADWLLGGLMAISIVGVVVAPQPFRDAVTGQHAHGNPSSSITQTDGQGLARLTLTVSAGATNFDLTALGASDSALYTAATHGFTLSQSFHRTSDAATAKLDSNNSNWWFGANRQFDLAIAQGPALDLTLNSGASRSRIDLSHLNFASFTLDGGASNTTITLGSASPRQKVSVNGGASSLKIRAPKSAALKITKNGGLITDNLGTLGLDQSGDTYTSPGFDTAATQITISVDGGASTINVERY